MKERLQRALDWTIVVLAAIGCLVASMVALSCSEPVPIPAGCAPATWDERRGCVETGEGAGRAGRITIVDCCGRAR
jgi:hypothetical protein